MVMMMMFLFISMDSIDECSPAVINAWIYYF